MKFITSVMIVLFLNTLFYLAQTGMDDFKVNNDQQFFTPSQNIIGSFNTGNSTNMVLGGIDERLPDVGITGDASQNNLWIFNIFQSISKAVVGAGKTIGGGLTFLKNVVTAFWDLLSIMGLPNNIKYAIAVFWYGFNLVLLVSWMRGGE